MHIFPPAPPCFVVSVRVLQAFIFFLRKYFKLYIQIKSDYARQTAIESQFCGSCCLKELVAITVCGNQGRHNAEILPQHRKNINKIKIIIKKKYIRRKRKGTMRQVQYFGWRGHVKCWEWNGERKQGNTAKEGYFLKKRATWVKIVPRQCPAASQTPSSAHTQMLLKEDEI